MEDIKNWRFSIPRVYSPQILKSSKFKLNEKSDYVHYGQKGFGEYFTPEKYWSPQIISQILYQAETGKIPVSGAGYGGSFAGEGFDAIWFDMSEIVRPTRDGIHGREYISTIIELGRKALNLNFDKKKQLLKKRPSLLKLPFPIVFNPLPLISKDNTKIKSIIKAAYSLGTIAIIPQSDFSEDLLPFSKAICLRLNSKPNQLEKKLIQKAKMVEIEDFCLMKTVKKSAPNIIYSIFLPVEEGIENKVLSLTRNGIDIIHLNFDLYGKSKEGDIPTVIKRIHDFLVDKKCRNSVSIIASGGIAAAEHVAKAMICGADCVAIDYILLIILGCSLWADLSFPCVAEHGEIDLNWAFNRLKNLIAAWRDQLLEVLGAMGIREIRRIRGEVGRAIFYKEEKDKFRNLFKSVSKNSKLGYLIPHEQLSVGDCRWPLELIQATIEQARTGFLPKRLEYRVGRSAGGFDRLTFTFEENRKQLMDDLSIDLSIPLNLRSKGPEIIIPMPIYSGGMSFGSISLNVMLARAMAAQELDSFMSTGEGGYPQELIPYKEHVITQVATGLFGVSEASIQRAPIIEFKYAQGAKPGLGGHLLAGKVTEAVANARESVAGISLFSPFPFHSVYSVEDHKKHIDWIKQVNPEALVIVKVSTPTDVDMVAVGSYYAGANVVNIDGSYGGTGAAPEVSKKNIAMPIEYAIPKVHNFLTKEGIRDEIVLIASGGIRTGYDIAKAIALGADGAMVGTADLVALGCERLAVCEKGDGCPAGITTTNPKFASLIDPQWGKERIINLRKAWAIQLRQILNALGMKTIKELRGRTDTIFYLDNKVQL
ncbi:MAG: glutamate synthase-related protein [Promethearchaeota archaeon]